MTLDQAARFLRRIEIATEAPVDRYPFDLPVIRTIRQAGGLPMPSGATFLVGENGSGKSTVLEAIAVAAGLNAEGGSQNYRFATRASESELGNHLDLSWGPHKPRSRFFLRAESYYNVATATEALGDDQLAVMGGVSAHERSHGESFLDLMRHRFYPGGLYLMDEPEAALSPRACMAVVALMADLVARGSQLVVATHSPILLALARAGGGPSVPATIYEFAEDGDIERVDFDQSQPVRLTKSFLDDPDRYLRHLM